MIRDYYFAHSARFSNDHEKYKSKFYLSTKLFFLYLLYKFSVTVENGPMKHRSSVSEAYKQHKESGITAKLLIHEQIRPKMLAIKSQIIRQSGSSSLNIILTTALTNHSNWSSITSKVLLDGPANVYDQASLGLGLSLFNCEYRKTPARAIPVPAQI